MSALSNRSWTFVLVTGLLVNWVEAWFEFCSSGNIYTSSLKDCPYGVLLSRPQELGNCWWPPGGDHLSSVCQDERDIEGTKKIQLIDAGLDDDEGPSSTSYDSDTCKYLSSGTQGDVQPDDKCTGGYVKVTKDSSELGPGGGGGGDSDNGNGNRDDNDTTVDRSNLDVRNQTLRLFLYMNELLIDENENQPIIRLVKLLKKSFDVLRTHCHTKYVSATFGKEIFRAFLFLLRESDLAHVKDISVVEFAKINAVLDRCLKGKPPFPFYLNGTVCHSHSKIDSIIKTTDMGSGGRKKNKTHAYHKNEFGYKWGKYDIPVDATWAVMDFTHGMCYGTFKADMNSHHMYEQALERLFTTELQSRPVRLTDEFYWDNVFRSHTETEMLNLDACAQASYLDSPYLHRLARPMVKEYLPIGRRKRDVAARKSVWCLQSQEEKDDAVKIVKDACP